MPYREPLPDGCPPDDAVEITVPIKLYRLVKTMPPTTEDFRSYGDLRPNDDFDGRECKARGLSVYSARASAERRSRASNFQGQQVCELTLGFGAGKLQKTGGAHHTWWPYAGYVVPTEIGPVQL